MKALCNESPYNHKQHSASSGIWTRDLVIRSGAATRMHYKNMPIQIYWKFYHQNWKFSDKNSDMFHIQFLLKTYIVGTQNIDCVYSLEPPRWGGSNDYPKSMFLSWNKKNSVYPCKTQVYYIKVGFKRVKII